MSQKGDGPPVVGQPTQRQDLRRPRDATERALHPQRPPPRARIAPSIVLKLSPSCRRIVGYLVHAADAHEQHRLEQLARRVLAALADAA